MFGIDLGITTSSVSCITKDGKVIDFRVLHGDTRIKDEWIRITSMAEAIIDEVLNIERYDPKEIIEPLVSIEEPVYPFRTRNPRSYFNLCCLYALVRNKLSVRNFSIYPVNPQTVKSTAAAELKSIKLKPQWIGTGKGQISRNGRLNKKGIVAAYKRFHNKLPDYNTQVGRETLADSFFIAKSGLDMRKLGVR